MKVAHVTIVRKLTQGQGKQLTFEHDASQARPGLNWTTIALQCGPSSLPFVRSIPKLLQPVFLRNLYGWWFLLTTAKNYDVVLVRHMTFDPFAFLFAPLIKNRMSVHHAKEVEELKLIRKGWKGRCASALERISGRFALRRALGIVGVTGEIAEYEKARAGKSIPILVYPNAINADAVSLIDDLRDPNILNIAFICGTFQPWHGLDKLIDAVSAYLDASGQDNFRIHLIGTLNEEQKTAIQSHPGLKKVFQAHGHMQESAYRPILASCEIGLTSLALERQNLTEAATLKVREMLAMGLPVFSGHKDTSLDLDFPYFLLRRDFSFGDVAAFALAMKSVSRETVKQSAKAHIEKGSAMIRIVEALKRSGRSDA